MSTIMLADMLGFSKIDTAVPAALSREIVDGQFQWETNPIIAQGIGGQRGVRKGLSNIVTSAGCTGVAKADWLLWFPGERVVTIDGMWDALAEVDDGTLGQEWVLTGGQPSRFGLAWNDSPDAEVIMTLEAMWALGTPQAVGTAAAVYYDSSDETALGYGHGDIGLTLETEDYGVIGIEFGYDLGAIPHNTAVVRSAGAKTSPSAIHVTKSEPTLELITTEPIVVSQLDDDAYTAGEVVITLDNGTEADDAAITISDMVCPDFNLPWEGEGRQGFRHSFILGSTTDAWGAVVAA